jgi:FAD-dependent urate hydroxylase
MAVSNVLVIGAGPFGLSISTHLRNRGVEHTIVGRPMNTWRAHMPPGLFLKSEPYGSVISTPARGYDLATYSRLHGFDDYVDRVGPLSLERFLGYADWFTDQLVPDVRDVTVTRVAPRDGGFMVEFAEEAPALVRQVIIATGVLPYAHIPSELSGLPPDLVTHSPAHDRLDQFRGRRVAVIGARAVRTANRGAAARGWCRRPGHRPSAPAHLGEADSSGDPASRLRQAAADEAVRGMGVRFLCLAGRIPAAARVRSGS